MINYGKAMFFALVFTLSVWASYLITVHAFTWLHDRAHQRQGEASELLTNLGYYLNYTEKQNEQIINRKTAA